MAHPSPRPKRHLDQYSLFCTSDGTVSLYFTVGRPSPSKLLIRMEGSGSHLTRACFLGPAKCTPQTHLDRFSHFCGADDRVRQTDRLRYTVCRNRPHLASAAMWHKNNKLSREILVSFGATVCKTVGPIRIPLNMEECLGPGHMVLDGDRAPRPPKGAQPPPIFCPFYCGQTVARLSSC